METDGSHHFKWDEIKTSIIDYILKSDRPVNEPEIREFLQEKYGEQKKHGKFDRSTINKHLYSLSKLGCVESMKSEGKFIFYAIKTLENLKKIRSEFPEIQLNNFEKSINLVLQGFGYNVKSIGYLPYFIQLYMSPSFFNACLETDIKLMLLRVLKLYRYDKGFEKEQRIEKLLHECEEKLNLKIDDDRFRESIEEFAQKKYELENSDDQKHRVELFYKHLQETIPELLKISIGTILRTPDDYQDLYLKISEILSLVREQTKTFEHLRFSLLFEYFFYQDMMSGLNSKEKEDEELSFAIESKKIYEEYFDTVYGMENKTDVSVRLFYKELEIISEFMAKHKIPSILSNISDDPHEVMLELPTFISKQKLSNYIL
jgi:hypothetical protein